MPVSGRDAVGSQIIEVLEASPVNQAVDHNCGERVSSIQCNISALLDSRTHMRAGVRGLFCRASQPFRALCRCITVVQQGQYWANTEQMGYVIEALSSAPGTRVINAKGEDLLTPREEQVVNLVAEGIGNREIGEQLGIKENTVKKSLLRTYDKLGVSKRVELVLYALTHRGSEKAAETDAPSSSPRKAPAPAHLCVGRLEANQVDLLATDPACLLKTN